VNFAPDFSGVKRFSLSHSLAGYVRASSLTIETLERHDTFGFRAANSNLIILIICV
jgi:hypothetical protein